jgi:peptidyl-prolyl cis-trans isomerase B (cyclophilin B)
MSRRRAKIEEEPAPKRPSAALPILLSAIIIIAGVGIAAYFMMAPHEKGSISNIEGGNNNHSGTGSGSENNGGETNEGDNGTNENQEASNPVAILHVRSDDEKIDGTIKMVLYKDKAPITVANFIKYAKNKLYDGCLFHRVEKDFVIQGGGYYPNGSRVPRYAPIESEADNGLHNTKWTVAMALGSDESGNTDVNSATSEFFINMGDNTHLDSMGFTVFGKVTEGYDVLDEINQVDTTPIQQGFDVPNTNIVIVSVEIQGA